MKKQVQQLLEEALADRSDLFLISMDVSEANQIRVIIDGDKGVKVQESAAPLKHVVTRY